MDLKKIKTMKFSLPPNWQHFDNLLHELEEHVQHREGSYKGLLPEALYTSTKDLLAIFENTNVSGTFVDLGCGTGKSVLLYGSLFPDRKAVGIEFESARLGAGHRFKEEYNILNVSMLNKDLLTCDLPEGDTYLLYFPTGPVLDRIMCELYKRKSVFRLIIIESHGDLIQRIELENWIRLIDEVELESERHYPMARIYERSPVERDSSLLPFEYSFKEKFIVINDGHEDWVGETYGMEWTSDDRFELKTPPRTIFWNCVKKLMTDRDIPHDLRTALEIRRLGEVMIKTHKSGYSGFIRKIIISPVFQVELSSGEKVEWNEILTITQGTHLCYVSSPVS